MYISTMWLVKTRGGERGVNVSVYKHPDGLSNAHGDDVLKYTDDPKAVEAFSYNQLTPGGNRVEAELDIVLEDDVYDRDAVLRALAEAESGLGDKYLVKPHKFDATLPRGRLYGSFRSNLVPLDPGFARAVFSLLRSVLAAALQKHGDKLARAA